jgi:hypothetical protein
LAIAIGSNPLPLSTAGTAYGLSVATSTDSSGQAADQTPSRSGSDTVTLSDAAKAYLAASSTTDSATLASNAREWFDQQYQALGINSAMLDGQVALDMTSQSRASLAIVTSNTQGLFTKDESAAAAATLQSRFETAMASHVVIARHTGDYAGLYQAASDYLDQAGADERTTATWQNQKQAVLDGLAAARQAFGKAPDTGNANDPVQALLAKSSLNVAPTSATDVASMAANARAMLDAQANKARDAGTELVFDKSRKVGQQVDYSGFDNQSLAVVALNQDSSFSAEESRAAKSALDARNRASILSAFDTSQNGGDSQSASLALLQQYSSMSDAERTVLGYTDAYKNQIIQNYRTISSFQNIGGSATTSSVLGAASYL